MDQTTKDYIEYIKMSNIEWNEHSDDAPECASGYALLIVERGNTKHLELGKGCGEGTSWASTDDIGWSGPVKCVVAWSEINIEGFYNTNLWGACFCIPMKFSLWKKE